MSTLLELVDNHRTDKNTTHSYLELYDILLSSKKDSAKHVLEIGIGDGNQGISDGGSIQLWHDYFLGAQVYAVDIKPIEHVWTGIQGVDRIKLFTSVDAYDPSFVEATFEGIRFDMMLDDGPHSLESMIAFLRLYSPLLAEDGILIIEDVQSMDWIPVLYDAVPVNLRPFVSVFDLRPVKNRYDDIVFAIFPGAGAIVV